MRNLLLASVLLLVTGCAGFSKTQVIRDLNVAMADLQKVVRSALPISKRIESQNSREFYSAYFVYRNGEYEKAENAKVRYTAHISILGDRRPYTIEVEVPVEGRSSTGEYMLIKYDEGHAKVITRRIQKALYERREDRNIIDDFRVF